MSFAYAKINLGLEVLHRRADGYHDIVTVLHLLELRDTVTCSPSADLRLECSDRALGGPDNLVLRAAQLLREECGVADGASLHLEKAIPVASGLGGGSSDAAVSLLALAKLWHLRLGEDKLRDLALRLGSDVPFFLNGAAALAEGRGDLLTALPVAPRRFVALVVLKSRIEGKTRALYDALSPSDYSSGERTRALASDLAARRGPSPELMVNCFERPALELFPALRACRDEMLAAGASQAHLSGSGPALFALTPDEDAAHTICRRLAERLKPEQAEVLLSATSTDAGR